MMFSLSLDAQSLCHITGDLEVNWMSAYFLDISEQRVRAVNTVLQENPGHKTN